MGTFGEVDKALNLIFFLHTKAPNVKRHLMGFQVGVRNSLGPVDPALLKVVLLLLIVCLFVLNYLLKLLQKL